MLLLQTGRVGGAGRREVGHGNLAERALLPAVPPREEWPYTVRSLLNILSGNGKLMSCAQRRLLNSGTLTRSCTAR